MMMRRVLRKFSSIDIPVINAEYLLNNHPKKVEESKKAVDILHKTGIMILKDPRVNEDENGKFLDFMEQYYENRSKHFYKTGELLDSNPEGGHQTGVVAEFTERARNHKETISKEFPNSLPSTPQPPPKDKKWRYMWQVGETDAKQAAQNSHIMPKNVIPADIPEFEQRMTSFGSILKNSCLTASEIIALGLGADQQALRSKMEGAPQILGPTGSDLSKHNQLGDILAGFHYDLSFMTIHGKSRYPGLYIWLRSGERIPVKVPEGCFLLQAAKQMELMTAGHIYAGFHEVIVSEETLKAVEKAKKEGRSLWRVSSTMFSSIRYDEVLKPLDIFKDHPDYSKFPPILTADQVEAELKAIELLH